MTNAYPFAPLLPITIPDRLADEAWANGYHKAVSSHSPVSEEYLAREELTAELHRANAFDLAHRLWLDLQAAGHHYGPRAGAA